MSSAVDAEAHYRGLAGMYLAAPVNRIYRPRIAISEGRAEIEIDVDERLHHAAGAVHGSVTFKMLDDAAFFAANSVEAEFYLLTAAFTTYMTRPVVSGSIRSVGRLVNTTRSQFLAEAIAYDADGREVARGNGVFMRSRGRLTDLESYRP